MITEMNTRLKQFLAAENITQTQFADTIKVVRASVSHVLSGRNNPGYDFIKAIMSAYPRLNIEWLMLGRGKMYKDEAAPAAPKEERLLFYDVEKEEIQESPAMLHLPQAEADYEKPAANVDAPAQMSTSTDSRQLTINQRKVAKVIILFDDGSFEEMGQ